MSKSIFGWSYPPGCSGPPDGDDCISPESEDAWNILEAAGIDDDIVSKVVAIIDDLARRAAADCPRCMAAAEAAAEAAQQAAEEYYQSTAYLEQLCPHGERDGDCNACMIAGDMAYDAARERLSQ